MIFLRNSLARIHLHSLQLLKASALAARFYSADNNSANSENDQSNNDQISKLSIKAKLTRSISRSNQTTNQTSNQAAPNKYSVKFENKVPKKHFQPKKAFELLKEIQAPVVVYEIDLLDLKNTIYPNIVNYLKEDQKLIVLVNNFSALKDIQVKKGLAKHILYELSRGGLSKYSDRVYFVDHRSGQGIDSLRRKIKDHVKDDDDVVFVGSNNATASQIIHKLYSNTPFNKTLSILPDVKKFSPFKIVKYEPITYQSEDIKGINFNAIHINGASNHNSYTSKLTLGQMTKFAPSMVSTGLKGTTYLLQPNQSMILGNFLRVDYNGSAPIQFNNFTHIFPKMFPIAEVKEEFHRIEMGKPNTIFNTNKKPLNFPPVKFSKSIELPLNFTKPFVSNAPFKFDLNLNGLGWISFNTNFIQNRNLKGSLKVFGWEGFEIPLSRPKLPFWFNPTSKFNSVIQKNNPTQKNSNQLDTITESNVQPIQTQTATDHVSDGQIEFVQESIPTSTNTTPHETESSTPSIEDAKSST